MSRITKMSPDTKAAIVTMYASGATKDKVCQQYKIGRLTLNQLLVEEGQSFRYRGDAARKHTLNHSFFDTIDTEEKAYFLGFLYADGYADEQRGLVCLVLHRKDEEIVYAIKSAMQSAAPIRYRQTPTTPTAEFVVNSKRLAARLAKLGCMRDKTFKLTFPEWLSPDLTHHFIRGYFDGDGHVSDPHRNRFDSRVDMLGTVAFTSSVADVLESQCNVKVRFYAHPRSVGIQTVSVRGNLQLKRLLPWLYKNATLFLSRKKARADQILATDFRRARGRATQSHVSAKAVEQIRQQIAVGVPEAQISEQFNVSRGVIYNIRTKRSGK